nr:hypothetical protein [Tanacetum cinerariifolium]
VLAGEKEEQTEKVAEKKVSTADPVTTAGEVVTTADVEVSAALSTTTTKDDELTLAQTLVEIKAAKPNALTTAVTTVAAVSTRPDITKRTTEHLESDISNKQKVDKNVEPVIDDYEDLKKCIEIVPNDGDEVLIEATPISFRSPTIIAYKFHKEGKKNYFKIIRADVSVAEGLQLLKSFYCQMDKDV